MQIGNFTIGDGHTFIIAEACSNIIGHLEKLDDVVDAIHETGADALKIQLFKASAFPPNEQSAKRRVEFPRELFPALVSLCRERGLAVGASVFDEEAVDLCESLGCDFLKLATREWDNMLLWLKCTQSGMPLVQSFDCRNITDLAFPVYKDTLYMGCVPEYPGDIFRFPNLLNKGWSSHTTRWADCVSAVSLGAVAVEKHIKFGKNDYESGWSLYPQEFSQMVNDIRWVERAR